MQSAAVDGNRRQSVVAGGSLQHTRKRFEACSLGYKLQLECRRYSLVY